MRKNQHGFSVLIVLIVPAVLLGAGWYVWQSRFSSGIENVAVKEGAYATITVQADEFKYSVDFDKDARKIIRHGRPFLEGKDLNGSQTLFVEIARSSKEATCRDCKPPPAGSTIHIVSKENVNGASHNLCYASSVNSYQLNFNNDETWYYVAVVPSDRSLNIDLRTVKEIVKSVKIESD